MLRYFALRLLRWIPGVLLLLLFVYAMMFYGAGDPVKLMFLNEAGDVAWDTEQIEAIRSDLGLDRPFFVQFGEYVWNLMNGDLGQSLTQNRSVNSMLASTVPITAQIALAALVIIAGLGIPLGVLAALNQNGWIDNMILGGALFVWSIPTFVAAPLLMVLLCLQLAILPVPRGWDGVFTINAIIPLFVASFRPMGIVIRQTRASVIEVLAEDYIRTARSKGIPEHVTILKHALRPVMTPVITQMGLVMSNLLAGSLFLEIVFGIPGIGRLLKVSITDSDYSVMMGCVLVILAMVTLTNMLVDLAYPMLDPRLRSAQRGDE
ncbi:MAG: peptide ABC transporter [Chloroflexi bacterium HGW-Chloroflexi-10]|jgi:ABC-type dipeptide/oligopeptide/nickel transport system permease component|nr:MAG: peptide ABC transporter [Chloroflexi bacterium HGW-Chloroflexi-10]